MSKMDLLRRPYSALRQLGRDHFKRPLLAASLRRADKPMRQALFGDKAELVPPLALMHDGRADYDAFKENGVEFYRILTERCRLGPSDSVLDIGCGIGRKTLPLLDYLKPPEGRYEGVDVLPVGVEWCRKRITPKYPNFRFQWMDVYNGAYNPTGGTKASEYRFPFPDNTFDLVLLGSVFTHTLPEETWNYLSEIKRMLRPGGRSLISYFLLEPESERLIAEGASAYNFVYPLGQCKIADPANPEAAIAYQEEEIRTAYNRLSFEAEVQIYHGSWSGRKEFLSFQDLIVATKPGNKRA